MRIIKIVKSAQQNPQAGQTPNENRPTEIQAKEASNKLFDFAIKFLLKDANSIVEYMLNPSEEAKRALANKAVTAVINGGVGQIPGVGWILENTGIGKAVAGTNIAKQIGESLVNWIGMNINLGRIPDSISAQNPKLKMWDLPDQMVTEDVARTIEGIKTKYAGNRQAIGLYMTLLFRMKDRMDLMNAQIGLLQRAASVKI